MSFQVMYAAFPRPVPLRLKTYSYRRLKKPIAYESHYTGSDIVVDICVLEGFY